LFEGKRYQLPLGVKDSVAGNGYAKIIAGTIERDIEYNNFDCSLDRYQNPNKRGIKPKRMFGNTESIKYSGKSA
jgi:hypothetical protein